MPWKRLKVSPRWPPSVVSSVNTRSVSTPTNSPLYNIPLKRVAEAVGDSNQDVGGRILKWRATSSLSVAGLCGSLWRTWKRWC